MEAQASKSHLAQPVVRAHDLLVDDKALVLRSTELYEAGDWGPEALEVNRELVERHPDAAGARYRLAVCFEEAGETLAARAAYQRFLERRAEGTEARAARRRLAILRERARAVSVRSPYAALAHGRKLQREANLDGAMVWYERAQELAKRPTERAQAFTGQASVLRTERRFADALDAAERAVAAQPSRTENMPAYAAMIAILADLGRIESARYEADLLLAELKRNRIANATAGRVYSDLFKRTHNPAHKAKASRCFREARRGR